MSTFKRLLNLGRGKAKVAGKSARETAESVHPDSILNDARHAAADAAEALADAIRPEDAAPETPATTTPPEPEATPVSEAPDTGEPDVTGPVSRGPVKKTL